MNGPFRSQANARRLAVLAMATTAAYLCWRAFTVNPRSLVQMSFLALEMYAGVSFGLFVFSSWNTTATPQPGPRTSSSHRVAVLIATYNEDEHVLLPTVAAAVALNHDHETWVLDDGRRPWVQQMAKALGARYLTRPDNSDAKAGNINHALGVVDADLVVILDADHIPSAAFLTNTVGYFDDPTVALVQTPQDFYNVESFEHIGDYSEEAVFYRVIQPGKNRWDAAFWCGTSAIVRTEALRSIGGVATASVTEDILTTIHLIEAGWRTVFHNEVLARGLAPSSYREFRVQRNRWAAGAMQVIRSRKNPWVAHGLTLAQRLAFTASLSGWFEGLRTVGYILLAVMVAFTGALPISVDPWAFLAAHVAVLVLTAASHALLAQGRHKFVPALLFEFLRIPNSITALSQLVGGRHLSFQVTAKGRTGDERERADLPMSLIVLTALTVAGLVLYIGTRVGILNGPLGWHVDVTAAVLVFDLVLLGATFRRAWRQDFGDERRRARRFERPLTFESDSGSGLLLLPSTTGAHIKGQLRTGNHVLRVRTREGTMPIRCWITPSGNGESTVEFAPGQYAQQAVLARTLFSECRPGTVRLAPTGLGDVPLAERAPDESHVVTPSRIS